MTSTDEMRPLDPFVEQTMRWCANCAGPQIFVPMYETDFARIGFCFGCGDESVAWNTHTTEAA